MQPTALEEVESIDMLRILEHGERVKMVECDQQTHSVDMLHDVEMVERMMQGDPVLARYS